MPMRIRRTDVGFVADAVLLKLVIVVVKQAAASVYVNLLCLEFLLLFVLHFSSFVSFYVRSLARIVCYTLAR